MFTRHSMVRLATVMCLTTGLAWADVAEVFVDDFNTPHDYVADGTEGTIWDGCVGLGSGEEADALNASGDRDGQLYIESSNGTWDDPWYPLPPFLYKYVEGDFIAKVQITDYAGTADAWVFHNDGGLMARASINDPNDEAGPGEDWVSIDYFPIWNCGNMFWSADDNVRTEEGHNGKAFDSDPWLQLERSGNVFYLRTSPDGITWTEMASSPQTRDDFNDLPLQVGLRQAVYNTGNTGYVAFDNFSITLIRQYRAYTPTPTDEAVNVDPNQDLSWNSGIKAQFHDVYFGTSFEDVNNADTSTAEIYKGRQNKGETSFDPGTLELGKTYYWRVDEINESEGDSPWRGPVWSFKVMAYEATGPYPPDGAECVLLDTVLSWIGGAQALNHWVYFGTTEPPLFKTIRGAAITTYTPPALEPDTVYYWRIDEKKGGQTWPGEVWSFKTVPSKPVFDEHLVAWWKLDEVCGDSRTILDESGNGYHGTFVGGDVQYTDGFDGDALVFDGRDDYVELPIGKLIGSLTNSTFAVWLDSQPGGSFARAFDFGTNDPNIYMSLGPRWYFMDDMYFAISSTSDESDQVLVQPTGFDIETGWHHVAVTIDTAYHRTILYYDGAELARSNTTLYPSDLGETTNNWLGRSHNPNNSYYLGSMDDFRIYNKALTEEELQRAMIGDPRYAWNPSPTNGGLTDVEMGSPLSWSAGDGAVEHDLYVGADANAVLAATPETAAIYVGRLSQTEYAYPLDWNTPYYWRVDEVQQGGSVLTGRLWSFTVGDFIIVDDIESYTELGCDRIYYTWRDSLKFSKNVDCGIAAYNGNGTGMIVGVDDPPYGPERSIVNSNNSSSTQSLPLTYDNTEDLFYSETDCTFDEVQNWSVRSGRDMNSLSLAVRGRWGTYNGFSGDGDTYTVIGSGADIWGTADQFHYVYMPLDGDGTITARIDSFDANAVDTEYAVAGVMIREGLDAGARYAAALYIVRGNMAFRYREITDEASTDERPQASGTHSLPYWVRLTRTGYDITGEMSTDGQTWDIIYDTGDMENAAYLPMSGDVYVGLCVDSYANAGTPAQAVFSNVEVTGTASKTFTTSTDIGLTINDPANLYVAIEDATGVKAVHNHADDPNAVLIEEWVDWTIPLSVFADQNVDLTQIKKMIIGVGDKQPGGQGKLYIDDIRLNP